MQTMKRRLFFVLLFLSTLLLGLPAAQAQDADAPPDTGWKKDLTGKFAASQVGFQNWQGGGVNSMALSTGLSGKATKTADRWEQNHELRLGFGVVKQDTLDVRKAEDVIFLSSAFQYKGDGFFATFNPTVAASFRSQFAEGFNFDKNPLGDGRPLPVKVSSFLAPATLTQSIGLTYDPNDWFTQSLGIGAKETVVTVERFRPIYGVDPSDAVRFEVGIEARTAFSKALMENIFLKSSLGLFAAYNTTDPPDLIWENMLTMKVNSWVNVNFEFVTLYDKDVSDVMQLKEVLSVGVSFILL